MAIFGDFFASCIFSELRAAHFRPASYIRTKSPYHVWKYGTAEIRRGKTEEKGRKKKPQDENIMVCPIP